jgi:putative flavoprotein involved in K+ transport
VVGSAQSGCQIAEELYKHGRKVYLCVGGAGRVPRKYRGKDIYEWMHRFGYLDRKVTMLRSQEERFAPLQHVSGGDGGHTLNLHQFAQDGVNLLGRLVGAQGNYLKLAGDLKKNLAKADKIETDIIKLIDERIVLERIDVPQERLKVLRDGYKCEETLDLDLQASGITTIIWANGYRFDYGLVKFPVLDSFGFPIQNRGVTTYPGLFFVGMPWLYTQKSGTLLGVGEDAEYIAGVIAAKG